jgi:hypothetical protein
MLRATTLGLVRIIEAKGTMPITVAVGTRSAQCMTRGTMLLASSRASWLLSPRLDQAVTRDDAEE